MNKVVWKAANNSQSLALVADVNELLLVGTRGSGKTEAQIMRYRASVGKGFGYLWRGIIVDRRYKALDDIVSRCKRYFPLLKNPGKFYSSKSDYKWVWPTGEELLFRALENEADYDTIHGQEFPFVGVNELTKWPTNGVYRGLISVNRCGNPSVPLITISTTNPYGVGAVWVKKHFLSSGYYGKKESAEYEIGDEKVTRTRMALLSRWNDNPHISKQYVAGLMEETNKAKLLAYVYGKWVNNIGGVFEDCLSDKNIIEPFQITDEYVVRRHFDWGSTHPFAVVWIAKKGENYYIVDEMYGGIEPGKNIGLKLSASEIAKRIIEREKRFPFKVRTGYADGQIFNKVESSVPSIANMMAYEGINFEPANKAAGSRVNGLAILQDMFKNNRLFIFSHCKATILTLQALMYDRLKNDDVDTSLDDHLYDAIRYGITSASSGAEKIKVRFPL